MEDLMDIEAISRELGRAPHTIRQWLKREDFPAELQPAREGGREKLVWKPDQIEPLRAYADERASRRGSFGR